MTAVLPISAEPAAIPREEARPGRWRRMPAKAKVGAILLGLFVLAGIIGPFVAPYDPSFQNPGPTGSPKSPTRTFNVRIGQLPHRTRPVQACADS